jgi:hypothetical protein
MFKRMSRAIAVLAMCAAIALLPADATAQVLYGSLVGNVTDQSGAAVPQANIKITQAQTNQSREAQSNESGAYSFPTIPGGTYTIAIVKPGFQTFTQRNVLVSTNSVVRVDVGLTVGQVAESIEVTEQAGPRLQTDRADVRGEVGVKEFENAPIPPGRNYEQLLVTVPGFNPPRRGGSSITNPSKALTFDVNGTSQTSVGVRIDGASAVGNWMATNAVYTPSLEAVETVNVVTSSFDAEQGIAGGASINVRTKSGTNALHGSLFEYHNDNALNSRTYFLPANQNKPKRIMNQFGGTVGGPIKKDKIFYFLSYEATYERKLASGFAMVPTNAVRNGDMSLSTRGIYDPLTGDAAGAGRTLFAGSIVPKSRISPIVQKITALIPQPLWPDLNSNNYYASGSSPYTRHRFDSKVDWNVNSKFNMAARFSALPLRLFVPTVFGTGLVGPSLTTGVFDDVGDGISNFWSGTLTGVYTVSPSLVIDGAFGYTLEDYSLGMDKFGWDKKIGLDVLGIPGTNGPGPKDGGWPGFVVDNYSRFGGGANAAGRLLAVTDPQYTYTLNASWIKGRHNFRFGVDLLRQHMNHWEPLGVQQTFTFSGGPTTVRGGASPDLYNSFATFLLGMPTDIQKSWQPEEKTSRAWAQGLFVRDQWQASRKLTFSYGVRWEYFPVSTRRNRGMEVYDFDSNQMLLCGNGSVPRNCGISVKQYWSPRLGLSYRATDSFVIRAGYSIAHDPFSMARPLLSNYPEQINQQVTQPNTYQPARLLSEGIPPVALPDLKAERLLVPLGVGITTPPKDYDRGYIQSWNLTLQKQLKGGFIAQAGYVGTTGIRMRSSLNVNAGKVNGGLASQPLYQKFGRTASTNVISALGFSRYNGLQAQLERRFANGFQMKAGYTWSKTMMLCCGNGYDPAPAVPIPEYSYLNKAVGNGDRTHVFTLMAVQELPFGKGKRWLNAKGFASALASGWQVSGLLARNSGLPFSVTSSGTSLNAPGSSQRADQVKPSVAILGGHGPGQPYFDPLAFKPVTEPRFGNAGFYSLRGPGLTNLDVSLFRQFSLTERWKIQFRAEGYNITNSPHFGNPGTNVSNMQLNPDGSVRSLGGYTEITGLGAASREGLDSKVYQFGLRVSF